jgi:hypothetical protein
MEMHPKDATLPENRTTCTRGDCNVTAHKSSQSVIGLAPQSLPVTWTTPHTSPSTSTTIIMNPAEDSNQPDSSPYHNTTDDLPHDISSSTKEFRPTKIDFALPYMVVNSADAKPVANITSD